MKHSKLFKPIILAALLLLGVITASAYDLWDNGIAYNYNDDGTSVSVTNTYYNYNGLTTANIPATVTYSSPYSQERTYTVTAIESSAFKGCSSLTSVSIPHSVTSIGDNPFSGCIGLESIVIENGNSVYDSRDNCNAIIETATNTLIVGCKNTSIPNTVTSIGVSAFFGCTGLTSITIPNSVTSIGYSAFYGCTGLTSITIPNSVTSIGGSVFSGCSSLASITIPNSITSIGDYTFNGCSSLASITIPNSVTSIGTYAFYGCSGLNKVYISDLAAWCNISFHSSDANPLYYAHHLYLNGTEIQDLVIPNSVTLIRNSAFNGCSGLTSVTIPNSVPSIGSGAFSGCSGLTTVTIPNSVTSIGGSAFSRCSGLTSVTIPNSVTSIGGWAFADCSGLNTIVLGDNVTEIGGDAFGGAYNLKNITCKRFRPAAIQEGTFYDYTYSSATLYVPKGSQSLYFVAPGWIHFVNIVEDGENPTTIKGDVNGDGKVNVSDVTALINIILGVI